MEVFDGAYVARAGTDREGTGGNHAAAGSLARQQSRDDDEMARANEKRFSPYF